MRPTKPLFLIGFYRRVPVSGLPDRWETCKMDGTLGDSYRDSRGVLHIGQTALAPGVYQYEVVGKVLQDSQITYQTAEEFKVATGSGISISIANTDQQFSTPSETIARLKTGLSEQSPVFWKFIDSDNFICHVQILVPKSWFQIYPGNLGISRNDGDYVCVFGGFVANAEFMQGGIEIGLDLRDYTYFAGQFAVGRDFAMEATNSFFTAIKNRLPFVASFENHAGTLADILDFKQISVDFPRTIPFDEWVLEDATHVITRTDVAGVSTYIRLPLAGDALATLIFTASDPTQSPPADNKKPLRFMFDPSQKGTSLVMEGLHSAPTLLFFDNLWGDIEDYRQDIFWNGASDTRLYYISGTGTGNIKLFFRVWDDTLHLWGSRTLIHTFIGLESAASIDTWHLQHVIRGMPVVDYHWIAISSTNLKKVWFYSIETGVVTVNSSVAYIRQYVHGRPYSLFGIREDGTGFWTRPTTIGSDVIEAGFIDPTAKDIPDGACYSYHLGDYLNCICCMKNDDGVSFAEIRDEHFRIQERLFCGKAFYPATHFTKSWDGERIIMFGNQPTGMIGGLANRICSYETNLVDPGSRIPRLDQDDGEISCAKALTKAVATWFSWWWINPIMVLKIESIMNTDSGTFNLRTEIADSDKGDVMRQWEDGNLKKITVNFGADREYSIGRKAWNTRDKSIDIKNVVYSRQWARELARAIYIVYSPSRIHLTSSFYREAFYYLLQRTQFRGKKWLTIVSQLDLANARANIEAIEERPGYPETIEFLLIFLGLSCASPNNYWTTTTPPPWIGLPDAPYPPAPEPATTSVYLLCAGLMTQILADLNAAGVPCGTFDSWWEENMMNYWSIIVMILDALWAVGYFD